jgi:UDP-glucose 4-epimerase
MSSQKKVVVVGGSGFIGSHVADQLSCAGYQVTIYDITESSWLRADQSMVVGDIQNEEKLKHTIKGSYAVYNFAALADLNQALDQSLKTAQINIVGNINVMEACRVNKVERFVYASTVYVHSREGGFYRCSKQASESYVEEYQQTYGLDYTILRYGSLYGRRAGQDNGIYRIVKSALEDGVIRYEGNKDSLREYIHVEDAAKISVECLQGKFKNESVVLTGQEPMRVIDMLKMLAEIMNLPEDAVEFLDTDYAGHYIRSPYAYMPKIGRKYIPSMHVDLGQGLLQVIDEISN